MALTKVSRGILNTGVADSSDATAITINSSENVTLAGTLAVTGVISPTTHIDMPDSAKLLLGTGDDLQIFHDGSNSFINNTSGNAGSLSIKSSGINLMSAASETYATFTADGAVTLYYDNAAKLATNSGGVTVTGTAVLGGASFVDNATAYFGTGLDLRIFHDGTHSYIKDVGTGDLRLMGTNLSLRSESTNEPYLNATENGAVTLYYDNAVKLATASNGVTVTGGLTTTLGVTAETALSLESGTFTIKNATGDSNGLKLYQAGSNTAHINNHYDGPLVFSQDNTEAMRIHSNTFVGIGTTSPNAQLHIGDASAEGSQANPALQIGSSTTYRLGFYTTAEGAYIENKNGDDGINFLVKTAGQVMRIDTSGNVGIGKTAAYGKLDILETGTGAQNRGLYVDVSPASNAGDGPNNAVLFSAGNAHMDKTMVRIHHEAPVADQKLLSIDTTGSNTEKFWVDEDGDVYAAGVIRGWGLNNSANSANIIYRSGSTTVVGNGATSLIVGDGTDGVGIGTATLSQTFNIKDTGSYVDMSWEGSARKWVAGVRASDSNFYIYDNNATAFRLSIDTSGFVGIGTTSPSDTLQIHNSATDANHGLRITRGSQTHGLRLGVNDSHVFLWTDQAQDLAFGTSNAQRMTVKADGKVGIGTTSPASPLAISNLDNGTSFSSNRVLQLIGTSTTDGSRVSLAFSGNTSIGNGLALIEAVNDDQSAGHTSLHMHTYDGSWNTENLVLKSGYVGIGTASPSAKLDIRGGGLANVPSLSLVGDTSGTYNHSINALNPNLTAGEANIIVVGSAASTNNSGYLGFKYASAGSNDNLISLGHWGNNFQLNVTGDGKVGIGTTAPRALTQIGSVNWSGGDVPDAGTARAKLVVAGPSEAAANDDQDSQLWIVDSASTGLATGGAGISFGGNYDVNDTNWANFAKIKASRDADSNDAGNLIAGHLKFYTRPNGGSMATERMRIDSVGNIFIGNSGSPPGTAELLLEAGKNIWWKAAAAGTVYGGITADTSNNIIFKNTNSGTERWRINGSGHLTPGQQHTYDIGGTNAEVRNVYAQGISFASTSNVAGMTSELLDDYEEGTFTPTIYGATTAGSTSGTFAGKYTKIGNQVTCQYSCANFSLSSAAGHLTLGGLPFASSAPSNRDAAGIARMYNQDLGSPADGYFTPFLSVPTSGTAGLFVQSKDNGTWSVVNIENTTGLYIEGTITYFV